MKKTGSRLVGVFLLAVTLIFAGCGGGNNNNAPTSATGTITADTTGTVPAGPVASPAGVTISFPADSTLTDALNSPVTGAVTTTVTSSTSASSLPAVGPTNAALAILLDITMNNGTAEVKNLSTPLEVVVDVPAGISTVDVFSFDGANWIPEQSGVSVSGGKATINITHLSPWACFSAPLSITTTSPLTAGMVGVQYSQQLNATGGKTAYTWSGTPPAGLILNASGLISGTPTTAGTTSFTVTVTDSATPKNSVSTQLSLTINPGALTITTSSLPAGTINVAYSTTLQAQGGSGSYTWSATGLPTGLLLNSATGVISGTPTVSGPFNNVAITVTDAANNTANANLSITINTSGPAVPAAPTGVGVAGGTNSETITWNAVSGATSYRIYFRASAGVTTANGTQVTVPQPSVAVTSPYRHSRLTTTPSWLAAGTTYFYIITAVNAAGESLPSNEVNATTSAVDGVALYGTSCGLGVSCHATSLVNFNHHGASAATIQTAINNGTGGMSFLVGLTAAQVQAIANVDPSGF